MKREIIRWKRGDYVGGDGFNAVISSIMRATKPLDSFDDSSIDTPDSIDADAMFANENIEVIIKNWR